MPEKPVKSFVKDYVNFILQCADNFKNANFYRDKLTSIVTFMETSFIDGFIYMLISTKKSAEYMANKVTAVIRKSFHLWFTETLYI